MGLLLFILIGFVLLSIGLYFIFPRVDKEASKGLIPIVNLMEWCKLIGRPTWHAFLWFIPIYNLFVYAGMAVDLVKTLGRYSFKDSFLAVAFGPIYFIYLGKHPDTKFISPAYAEELAYKKAVAEATKNNDKLALNKLTRNPFAKETSRDWAESIIFAVFAAAFIRMFFVEAYKIPTPSMEDSLLVGDHLFVSKMSYGIRMPQTLTMVPLLHNRMPFVNMESYLDILPLKYRRFPSFSGVEQNDPIVFNYPEGDSVFLLPNRAYSLYDYRRDENVKNAVDNYRAKLVTRPMDKTDFYIKRCVGLPGQTLELRDAELFIDGKPANEPSGIQRNYLITYPKGISSLNKKKLKEWGISMADQQSVISQTQAVFPLTLKQLEQVKALGGGIDVAPFRFSKIEAKGPVAAETIQALNLKKENVQFLQRGGLSPVFLTNNQKAVIEQDSNIVISEESDPKRTFPHDPQNFPNWTVNNYGPITIPAADATVQLTPENIALYKRIITKYEGNDLAINGSEIKINGEVVNEYTFKRDYFWMMGDNRHNSEDSRYWGFVSEEHIIGKPLFIWFSTDEGNLFNGIRWNRLFTNAEKKD